jgi:hypothetical protein
LKVFPAWVLLPILAYPLLIISAIEKYRHM